MKIRIAAIIRVGNIGDAAEGMIQIERHFGCRIRRLQAFKRLDVRPVHAQDQVEAVKVPGHDLSRPLPRNVETLLRRNANAAWIGRVAGVPGAEARRVNCQILCDAGIDSEMAKDAFRERRAADVAKADKQNRLWQIGLRFHWQ